MKYKDYLKMLFDAPNDDGNNNDGNTDDGQKAKSKNNDQNDEKKYSDEEVNAIIDKKFAEWQKKQKKAVDEATKLANMTAQEKAEHERDAWEQKYNELLAENTRSTLTIQATKMLTDDGLNIPTEIISLLVSDDADTTKSNVVLFTKAFKSAVQEAVKDANKKPSPKVGGNSNITKQDILKVQDVYERQRLINENINLFRK